MLVYVKMATKIATRKQVRFTSDSETFNYSFPCHVCDFETARKKELEDHLLSHHSLHVSFTHSRAFKRQHLDDDLSAVPKMILIGLGLGLYFSSYAWLLITFCKLGESD